MDYFPLNTNGGRRSGYEGLQIPITEIILHICIWSLIVEEIRQVENILPCRRIDSFDCFRSLLAIPYENIQAKFGIWLIFSRRFYISWDLWRDFLSLNLCSSCQSRRHSNCRVVFFEDWFRIFLCLDLILWYVRTLQLFAAYEKLGPKLIMIFNTVCISGRKPRKHNHWIHARSRWRICYFSSVLLRYFYWDFPLHHGHYWLPLIKSCGLMAMVERMWQFLMVEVVYGLGNYYMMWSTMVFGRYLDKSIQ